MEAIILAGGLGKRLRSVVSDRPKPLADIAGKPFLDYLLGYWIKQGVQRFVLSVGYRSEMLSDRYGDSFQGIPLVYANESKPLGTGGGLINAAQQLDLQKKEPIVLLNGDTFFALDFNQMYAFYNRLDADVMVACRVMNDPDRYGVVDLSGNNIKALSGGGQHKGVVPVNAGVYLIRRSLLQALGMPEALVSLEADMIPQWIRQNIQVIAYQQEAYFIDIGIPADYAQAQTTLPVAAEYTEN